MSSSRYSTNRPRVPDRTYELLIKRMSESEQVLCRFMDVQILKSKKILKEYEDEGSNFTIL